MRSLEKQPSARFQSAEEMIRELDALEELEPPVIVTAGRGVVERTFPLSEDVCRKLDRATLDPRIIGDDVSYIDNEIDSDTLVCFFHGTGLDHSQAERFLRELPYRVIAPTLYGFEPDKRQRIPLALGDHMTIFREIVQSVRATRRFARFVLVGLSSGADVALRLIARDSPAHFPVDALLSLGCNLSLETCFATRIASPRASSPRSAPIRRT
jgi:pimeloyl-ACP methyl ester carboxylesterase